MHLRSMSDDLTALSDHGLVVEPGPFARLQDAWSAARVLVDKAAATNARLAGRGRLCDPTAGRTAQPRLPDPPL
jgi:hypothetical protein